MKSMIAACLLAIGVVAFGVTYRTGVASGIDSYAYVTAADLWAKGNLHVPQPWMRDLPWPDAHFTAAPTGYRPAADDLRGSIVPVYSPGLSMLMAVAKMIGGYAAIFWVVPLLGGLFVLSSFGIGRRIGGPVIGLAAAFLTAFSPVMLFMVEWPMTDVAVASTWAAATWAVLGPSRRRASIAGFVAAAAILIRPNLVAVGALMGLWVIARDMRRGGDWWRVDRGLVFGLSVAPGLIAVMAINRALYGSPFVSGYGTLGSVLHASNLLPNVQHYLSWLVESQTWLVVIGLVPLALPVTLIWRDRDRAFDAALLTLIAIGTLSCYLLFMPLDEWWYLRFLMPLWPGLFIGVAWVLFGQGGWKRVLVATLAICWIANFGVAFMKYKRITDALEGERRFVKAAELTRENTEPNSMIFSLVHSGSVRYYGERMTMRYDLFPPEWLDRGIDWLSAHGAHSYLLVEDWELTRWKEQFGPMSARGRMDMKVVFELQWPTHMWLFDLTKPKEATWPYIDGFKLSRIGRTAPPAPPPVFSLKPVGTDGR